MTNGCEKCRTSGDHIHGDDPIRDFCIGCGTGMPAAKMAGGIRFCEADKEDGTWWCEPCGSIEGSLEELEDKVLKAERTVEEAWKVA